LQNLCTDSKFLVAEGTCRRFLTRKLFEEFAKTVFPTDSMLRRLPSAVSNRLLPVKERGCCMLEEEGVMWDVAPESGYHIDISPVFTMFTAPVSALEEDRFPPLIP